MQNLPHRYRVDAVAQEEGLVSLNGDRLASIRAASPAEFGGPGDQWSPETLLVASVAGCFILSFRAIARASKLEWRSLDCHTEGVLARVEAKTRFTELTVRAKLSVPPSTDTVKAHRLMEKAEETCLITNSLLAEPRLKVEIVSG